MSRNHADHNVIKCEVTSIEDLREPLRDADVETRQLSAEPIAGDLLYVTLDDLVLAEGNFSGTVELQGPLSQDNLTLGVLLGAEDPSSQWLKEIAIGDVGVFAPGQEHLALYRRQTSYSAFTMPESTLMAHAERERYRVDDQSLRTSSMIGHGEEARKTSQRIGRLARQQPDLFGSAAIRSELRSQLLDGYLQVLSRVGQESRGSATVPANAAALVAAARDIIERNHDRLVTINELSHVLEVPRRTLHRSFINVLGMPPAAYLRLYRLNGARQELIRHQSRGDRDVTRIATSWGFCELGRFSAQYQRMFGELPSHTLAGRNRAI